MCGKDNLCRDSFEGGAASELCGNKESVQQANSGKKLSKRFTK